MKQYKTILTLVVFSTLVMPVMAQRLPPVTYSPKTKKNPFLTVGDLARLEAQRKQEQEEARKRAEERRRRNAPKPKVAAPAFNPLTSVEVSGVVIMRDSRPQAIINGEVVSEGTIIKIGANQILITRIQNDFVYFVHNGKTYRKRAP